MSHDHLRPALCKLLGKAPREIGPKDEAAVLYNNPLIMDRDAWDRRDQLVIAAVWVGRHPVTDLDGEGFDEEHLGRLLRESVRHLYIEVGSFRSVMVLAGFPLEDPNAEEWRFRVRFGSEPRWSDGRKKHVRHMRESARLQG